MNDTDELAAWVRLMDTEGVGPQTARELLGRFGMPSEVFGAGFSALQKCVPEKVAYALCEPVSDQLQGRINSTLHWAAQPGNHVLTLADDDYPKSLLTIADPPPVLYAKGKLSLMMRPAIAIVGSRNATKQGIENAERFAQALSTAGLTVISGMALGIDGAAHQGALLQARSGRNSGSTVAVTGTGLDLVYPARHRDLAHRIADTGCLLSEYPLGTPAIASNFPRRNRIISGLSLGVLVVEAAAQSGSLITARSALEQGREVFAIPGSIHSPLSKGCHLLIRQGAKLVESAQDILEELRWDSDRSSVFAPTLTPALAAQDDAPCNALLTAAGYDPVSVDQLAERTNLSAAEVQACLLTLELDGMVELLPGGQYRRLGKI